MKKLILNTAIIVSFLIASSVLAYAQGNPNLADSMVLNTELPELSQLLDSALVHSPLLRVSDKQISQVLEQIKIEKRSWSDYFSLDANAKYGLYNQVTLTDITTSTNNTVSIPSKNQQFNYFFGLTFKMPLSDLANKGNKLKILNENISEKQEQREQLLQQLQQLIIEEYYNLVFLTKSVKINQDILQSLSTSLMKSDKDIQSGFITMESYNTILVQKGKAEENYFKVKSEYYAQYKKLVLITGYKF